MDQNYLHILIKDTQSFKNQMPCSLKLAVKGSRWSVQVATKKLIFLFSTNVKDLQQNAE